ncbi:MAG: site-specific integrase [Geodermatophilaceae bacterium]|nr:site-specific integrase [Geodermatophilaceae bacterium]
MASIVKRPNGQWRARYRDLAGHEHARHFRRKVDATRWLDSVAAAVEAGTYVDPDAGRSTLAEYAPLWLTRQVHLKPSTRSRYAALMRCHIVPTFGALPLAKIERSAVAAWVLVMIDAGLAGPTVRHAHRVLHMILNAAVDDGRLARNPASRVKLPRDRRREKRFLTHPEVAALADAAGPDRLVVLVLAYCGLRFGELAALRVRNVDPLRRRLQIQESATEVDGTMVFGTPKSHQCRSVPVPRSLIDELAAACAGKAPSDLVFTAPQGGVLWLRNWRRRVFDSAVTAAGLGELTPHELRHTAASLAVAAGANVKAVQRMLGHASAAMTLDVYSGLFDDDLDAVADRLDAAARAARELSASQRQSVSGHVITMPR